MGEQRNLTEENVEELRAKLEEIHKDNPDLEYRFWEQTKDEGWPSEPQPQDEQPSSKKIFEKLDAIERQLKLNEIRLLHLSVSTRWAVARVAAKAP